MKTVKLLTAILAAGGILSVAGGCAPTIKVEAPDKPIHLKVDVNIKQEILLKVEEDVAGVSVTPAIPMAKRAGWIGERLDGYLGVVATEP
ncbi:MAG: YnbE family lipoprotein, partial [Alphaproteobacteria bacterium]|nr:YnbE family lipoprotein [Alphaproteobacteria bacterium]